MNGRAVMTGPSGPLGAERRTTGQGASSLKYDILTALLVTAARGAPDVARLAVRLSLLITARYNWRAEMFQVGQVEIARLWGVTERQAKREMAAMRARGWIAVTVPAARGRVARHRIDMDLILRETMPHWSAVGPDYVARMTGRPVGVETDVPSAAQGVAGQGGHANVVPFAPRFEADSASGGAAVWTRATARLSAEDPAVFAAWFAGLEPVEVAGGVLTLAATSRFVADYVRTHHRMRLLSAAVEADPAIRDIAVIAGGGRAG